jgi:uncharacterized membrane protein
MSESPNLERRQWNYVAVMGAFVVVFSNLAGAAFVLTGKATWGDWVQIIGTGNAIVLTWISARIKS